MRARPRKINKSQTHTSSLMRASQTLEGYAVFPPLESDPLWTCESEVLASRDDPSVEGALLISVSSVIDTSLPFFVKPSCLGDIAMVDAPLLVSSSTSILIDESPCTSFLSSLMLCSAIQS